MAVQGPLSIARFRSQLSMYVLLITIESRDIKRDNAAQYDIVNKRNFKTVRVRIVILNASISNVQSTEKQFREHELL